METTIYSVTATITGYRLAPDSSIHLILADERGRTMVAQIPAEPCTAGSRFSTEISEARRRFESRFYATPDYKQIRQAVEVRGIGFFDFLQSQRGLAPNGLSLYPVIDLDFTPPSKPKPPPKESSRHRAVRIPGSCVRPTLTITASKNSACSGESTTISWQSSNPNASVSIDGIGAFLPASGSQVASLTASRAYSGRASTTTCGLGDEAVAVVTLKSNATASLFGPGSVKQGSSGTINFTIDGATSWTLTSALGNSISPSSGTITRSARYEATKTGTDTITLTATGGACGAVSRSATIIITAPANLGLACCDGTRSPSCFNCNDKRGCCSSHGGVCGCPSILGEDLEIP